MWNNNDQGLIHFSDSDVVGINSDKLKLLVLDLYDYRDKVSSVFDQFEKLVYESSQYYKCSDGDAFRKKAQAYSSNFDTVKHNIKTIIEDYESVLSTYKSNVQKNVDIFAVGRDN